MPYKRLVHWMMCAKFLTGDGAGKSNEYWMGQPKAKICEEIYPVLQINSKHDFKYFKQRCPTWINNTVPSNQGYLLELSVTGTGHLPRTYWEAPLSCYTKQVIHSAVAHK